MQQTSMTLAVLIIFLSIISGYSQTSNSVLVLIESPNFELIAKFQQLKIYHYDDSYLIGEIESSNLWQLKNYDITYHIIDSHGWSGDYYVLIPRTSDIKLDKARAGQLIFVDEHKAIVKIAKGEEQQLFSADYQLEKISRTNKSLSESNQFHLTFPTAQESTITNIINKVSASSLKAGVERLQDFKTRYTYSDSIIPAGQWIYDQYVSFGYTNVKFDTFYLNNQPHRNIIVTKPGLIYPDSVIMLGGHFDSIVSGSGTNPFNYAPGADDNASGAMAAIEAARVLAYDKFAATIKFAAWDAEEVGLVGSEEYSDKASDNNEPISLYINFDMIGNVSPQYNVNIYSNEQTMPLAELTAEIAKLYTALSPYIPGNIGGSDHRPFQLNGYPAFVINEDVESPNYHRPSDVTNNLDFEYMREVVKMAVATTVFLASSPEPAPSKPLVKYDWHRLDDDLSGSSYGNGNGYVDAGEKIELAISLKNDGESAAYQVFGVISCNDPYITILSGTQSFGTIESNAMAVSQSNFIVQIASDAPNGHKIAFELQISDLIGNNWQDSLAMEVIMPDLDFHRQDVKQVSGNGDDKIDPGEIFDVFLELKNIGLRTATGVSATLKCDHPSITILDSLANFTDIPVSAFGNNSHDQFIIKINSTAKFETIPFLLRLSEGQGFCQTLISFNLAIGQGKILLVEDDGRFDLSHYYKNAFDGLGIPYSHWDTQQQGILSADTLLNYHRVVWYTGMELNNSLVKYGTKALESYLDNGGKLFINGSLFPFSVRDSLIISKYLYATYIDSDSLLHHLTSQGIKPAVGDIDFWLASQGDNNQNMKSEIAAQLPAQPILFYDLNTSEGTGNIKSSGTAAIAVTVNNYRAIMFSFGWEGIRDKAIRDNVLIKILNWLQEAQTVKASDRIEGNIPTTFDLSQNYPNPFNASTTIQFQLPKTSFVTITVFNILGKEIKILTNSAFNAGKYKVIWNAKDNHNQSVTSGVYIYQIKAGNFQMTRKMIVLY